MVPGGGGVALAPLGVVAVLTGLTLVTDHRGAATATAAALKEQRPLGVDCSRSFLATAGWARFFGAFAVLVDAGLTWAAVSAS